MIYLDTAATSFPKPESVYRAMDEFLRNTGGSAGRGSHSLATSAATVVEQTRVRAARFFGVEEASLVLFTPSCTESINLALKGVLQPGDHVITDSIGHNAMVRPLAGLEQAGVEVTRIPADPITGIASPAQIQAAITPRTKLLSFTHGSNVTGVVQPVEEYGAIARAKGLLLLVDAAQTAGLLPMDMGLLGIDMLAVPGHKGLMGPPGIGLLCLSKDAHPESLIEGGTGSYSERETQPLEVPDRYESGTMNGPGIAGLGAGLQHIEQRGIDAIYAHELALTEHMVAGLRKTPGVTLFCAPPDGPRVPVVSFNIKGYSPGEVGEILDQAFDIKVRTGCHCAPAMHRLLGTWPEGAVRMSPGATGTKDEIDVTVDAVGKIAAGG